MMTLTLKTHNSPYIRYRESSRTVMGDTIIALAPLFFIAYFYYGPRTILVGLAAVITCTLAQWGCDLLQNRRLNLRDLSPVVTGMILALMMPAAIDLKVVVSAGLFAILVAKAPFGGTGSNLFNPAAAGIAFATVSWSGSMFAYTQPLERLPLQLGEAVQLVSGPAATLQIGGVPNLSDTGLLLGNFPGPMGTGNALLILACLIYLLVRRSVRWYLPAVYLASASIVPLFVHAPTVGPLRSVLLELASGSLLFVAVFMLTDPVCCPKRRGGRVAYAAAAGIMTMVFRYFGSLEQGTVFALLLVNAVSPGFDYLAEAVCRRRRGETVEA